MKHLIPVFRLRAAVILATAGAGLVSAQVGTTQETAPTARPGMMVARPPGSLNLLLTQSELRDWVRDYERQTGQNLTAPIQDDDEVIVAAPGYVAPMRDVSQDAWGGIAAPFWAILNPGNAWRIFVPIPPKGDVAQSEPPAPDPR
jgi:hypothetical protein